MTVKVLRPGKSREWSAEIKCSGNAGYLFSGFQGVGCGAILEVHPDDLTKTQRLSGDQFDEYLQDVYIVECPECHFTTFVDVPSYIGQFVEKVAESHEKLKHNADYGFPFDH